MENLIVFVKKIYGAKSNMAPEKKKNLALIARKQLFRIEIVNINCKFHQKFSRIMEINLKSSN